MYYDVILLIQLHTYLIFLHIVPIEMILPGIVFFCVVKPWRQVGRT
jgi:hypothetical protein